MNRNFQFLTMETIWWSINRQRVFLSIEFKLPIFDSVCDSTNNAAKIRSKTLLFIIMKSNQHRNFIFANIMENQFNSFNRNFQKNACHLNSTSPSAEERRNLKSRI